MLDRLFPRQIDNCFTGQRAALWLLGLYVALKLAMSLNSIFNTASVAGGADGIPLDSYDPAAAREVLTLFSLVGLGQLALACVALAALVRYRAIVALVFLLLLGEALARRAIVVAQDVVRTEAASAAVYINVGLLVLLIVGLVLALIPRRGASA